MFLPIIHEQFTVFHSYILSKAAYVLETDFLLPSCQALRAYALLFFSCNKNAFRSLIVSPYLVVSHACLPRSNHACPPGATMHAPPSNHTPPQSNHAPPRATTHDPPEQPHTPPPLWIEWHTLLKILPCPNFVAGGKYSRLVIVFLLKRIFTTKRSLL